METQDDNKQVHICQITRTSPNPNCFVSTARCKKLAIGAPGNTFHLIFMTFNNGLLHEFSWKQIMVYDLLI